jgi:xanthine/uracil permease
VQDEQAVHAVDEWLPLRWSLPLGFQQLLAAYASIIIAPLVLASALGWPQEQTTYLLAAGLLGSGVATLIQCLGLPGLPIGTRLPVVQGTTVAVIPPLMAIGADGDLTAMFGGTIVAGAVCLLLAGFWSRLLRFFPPLVTGTVITVIGVSLMPVAVMWLSGGRGFGAQDTSTVELGLGLGTLLLVLLVMRFGSDFLSRIAILVGLVAGSVSRCAPRHGRLQRHERGELVQPAPALRLRPTELHRRCLRRDDRDHAGHDGRIDR